MASSFVLPLKIEAVLPAVTNLISSVGPTTPPLLSLLDTGKHLTVIPYFFISLISSSLDLQFPTMILSSSNLTTPIITHLIRLSKVRSVILFLAVALDEFKPLFFSQRTDNRQR